MGEIIATLIIIMALLLFGGQAIAYLNRSYEKDIRGERLIDRILLNHVMRPVQGCPSCGAMESIKVTGFEIGVGDGAHTISESNPVIRAGESWRGKAFALDAAFIALFVFSVLLMKAGPEGLGAVLAAIALLYAAAWIPIRRRLQYSAPVVKCRACGWATPIASSAIKTQEDVEVDIDLQILRLIRLAWKVVKYYFFIAIGGSLGSAIGAFIGTITYLEAAPVATIVLGATGAVLGYVCARRIIK